MSGRKTGGNEGGTVSGGSIARPGDSKRSEPPADSVVGGRGGVARGEPHVGAVDAELVEGGLRGALAGD